jgi:hypothetical protein
MDWARILACVTGTVDQELLARNEYLATKDVRPALGAFYASLSDEQRLDSIFQRSPRTRPRLANRGGCLDRLIATMREPRLSSCQDLLRIDSVAY